MFIFINYLFPIPVVNAIEKNLYSNVSLFTCLQVCVLTFKLTLLLLLFLLFMHIFSLPCWDTFIFTQHNLMHNFRRLIKISSRWIYFYVSVQECLSCMFSLKKKNVYHIQIRKKCNQKITLKNYYSLTCNIFVNNYQQFRIRIIQLINKFNS